MTTTPIICSVPGWARAKNKYDHLTKDEMLKLPPFDFQECINMQDDHELPAIDSDGKPLQVGEYKAVKVLRESNDGNNWEDCQIIDEGYGRECVCRTGYEQKMFYRALLQSDQSDIIDYACLTKRPDNMHASVSDLLPEPKNICSTCKELNSKYCSDSWHLTNNPEPKKESEETVDDQISQHVRHIIRFANRIKDDSVLTTMIQTECFAINKLLSDNDKSGMLEAQHTTQQKDMVSVALK